MSEEKLTSMIVKTLRDENGNLFAPVTTYKALINDEGQSLSDVLEEKVDFVDIKGGDNINVIAEEKLLTLETGIDLAGKECIFNLDNFKVIDYATDNPYAGIELETIQDSSGLTGGTTIKKGYILQTNTSSIYFTTTTNSSRYTIYDIYINDNGEEIKVLQNRMSADGSGFANEISVTTGRYTFSPDFGIITSIVDTDIKYGIVIKDPKIVTISATLDYNENINKPSINDVILQGNKTHADLGLQQAGDYAYNSRVDELEDKIDDIDAIQKQASLAVSYRSYEEMIQALNAADFNLYVVGQSIYIKTDDVIDVWVMEKMTEAKSYTYTSDAKVQQDLTSISGLEVGHYVLAPLETERVDLTNYVEFTDIPTLTKGGVIKIAEDSGVHTEEGIIYTTPATEAQIVAKEDEHVVITPTNLETAVKSVISKTSDLINDSDFTSKDYVDTNVLDKIEEYITANQESLTGESGVYVGPEAPTNPFVNVWIDTDDTIGGYDYDSLDNKPSINGIELTGNKTSEEFGLGLIKEFVLPDEYTKEPFLEIYLYWKNTGILPNVKVASGRGWTLSAIEESETTKYFTFSSFGNTNSSSIQVHKKYISATINASNEITSVSGTKFSSLTDHNVFIPSAFVNSSGQNFLATSNSNAYTPSGNYNPATKKYVDDKIKEVVGIGFSVQIVDELPEVGMNYSTIYLISTSEDESNIYDEYIFLEEGIWEKIGSTAMDMSNYYSKTEVDAMINELRNLITTATSADIQNIVNPPVEEENTEEEVIEEVEA